MGGAWSGERRRWPGLLTAGRAPLPGCIKVTYTAGYDPVPADVELAVCQVVAQLKAARSTGHPLGGEDYEDYSYSLATDMAQAQAGQFWRVGTPQQIVNKYRRMAPRFVVLG
jgi:hypothetical protein